MFKIITFFTLIAVAAAAPGHLIETHSLLPVAPALVTKTAVIDNSASSALTHQSFTKLEKKIAVAPVVHSYSSHTPLVKTIVHEDHPVVHASPAVHIAPIVHSASFVHNAPIVHSLQSVHAAPAVHVYSSGHVAQSVPVVHSAPYVKTIVAAPATLTVHH